MQSFEEQFLFLLKASLNNEMLPEGYCFDVSRVFSLALRHNLLPVIFSKARECSKDVLAYKTAVMRSCAGQISKNENFRILYNKLCSDGINVLIVKGPVCADCYPVEHCRLSSDFDIVVSAPDRDSLHQFLLKEGFEAKGESYLSDSYGLYLEVSTKLGEGDDRFAVNADKVFGDFFKSAVISSGYLTLKPEMHFVYLLYHAFKHFIGSGFGLKQISDIYMYLKKYESSLDFEEIFYMIDEIDIRSFADNVFYLIKNVFDCQVSGQFFEYNDNHICFDGFLADLLDAGAFGKSSEDRLHSASVVHSTVKNEGKTSFLRTLFPTLSYMKTRFSVLCKLPFLLPFFWLVRLVLYLFSAAERNSAVSPKNTIKIADERIALMKKMGIL